MVGKVAVKHVMILSKECEFDEEKILHSMIHDVIERVNKEELVLIQEIE